MIMVALKTARKHIRETGYGMTHHAPIPIGTYVKVSNIFISNVVGKYISVSGSRNNAYIQHIL